MKLTELLGKIKDKLNFRNLSAKNIRYGIYAVIFLMPLYLWRFSIFGIPTTVLEMMIYVLFLVWILNKMQKNNFYAYFSEARLRSFGVGLLKNNTLSVGIALLFLGLAISTLNSSDLKTSLGIFKGWFVDPFLFFLVFISVTKKEEHIIASLKSWLASGVAVSLVGIFYLLNNDLTFDGRLKAFFLSPNHLAMYLAPAFLVGLFFLLNKKVSGIRYPVSGIFLTIISIPLYFTYSYGALLGIFAAMVYLFTSNNFTRILRSSTRNTKHSMVLIIVLLMFISINAVKFNQIINSNNRSSFHSRLMIWNASAEIIKDNPLSGIGPGTFQETYLSYSKKFSEPYLEWAVPQPHNLFLAFYLQTGIFGFIGFVLILFWFFSRDGDLSRLLCGKNQDAMNRVSTIMNILMVYILVHGLVDTTYWKNDLSLMFWLVVGIMIVSRKILKFSQNNS